MLFEPADNYSSKLKDGQVEVDEREISMPELEKKYSSDFLSDSGGHWKPPHCKSHSKVAVIIPYRNREKHLRLFLNHMHSFLRKQLLDYAIYVIEEVTLKFKSVLLSIL
jgi:hypothetical protein